MKLYKGWLDSSLLRYYPEDKSYYNSQFCCCLLVHLFVCLFIYLFACLPSNYFQIIGTNRLKFSRFDGGHPGDIIRSSVKISLFANSSQIIEPKGLKYTGLNEGHLGVD